MARTTFSSPITNQGAGRGIIGTPEGFRYDLGSDPEAPIVPETGTLDPVAQQLRDMYVTIGQAYGDLISRGRNQDAEALRTAAERFGRAGSTLGVNKFQRTRALTDLKNRMNTASKFAESKFIAQKLSAQSQNLGQLASVTSAAFGQEMNAFSAQMQRAGYGESRIKGLRQAAGQQRGTGTRVKHVSPVRASGVPRGTPVGQPALASAIARTATLPAKSTLPANINTGATFTTAPVAGAHGPTPLQTESHQASLARRGVYGTGGTTGAPRPSTALTSPVPLGVPPTGQRPATTTIPSTGGSMATRSLASPVAAPGVAQAPGVATPVSQGGRYGQGAFSYQSPNTVGFFGRDPATGRRTLSARRRRRRIGA